ncbi:hypothetical protein HU200_059825 [Digitaria exilis]|uniref:non-specific serine/threonine protein kinase n=1 Tax=Digitaria exilis TaxID=1010633 RepID=A0A835ADD9_9POAL|nr:hypothetical protein HU200_059825 [Digitaria exilis]
MASPATVVCMRKSITLTWSKPPRAFAFVLVKVLAGNTPSAPAPSDAYLPRLHYGCTLGHWILWNLLDTALSRVDALPDLLSLSLTWWLHETMTIAWSSWRTEKVGLARFCVPGMRRSRLTWPRRHEVVVGVARGLLYLHEDAHTPIIHRDIKASNILLDDRWVPKIADFGMARLFPEAGDGRSRVHTRVAGTNGYMAPEYLMHGDLSTKVDVFSFGVVVLEIVSGRKNSAFVSPDFETDSLLEYAWRLYKKGQSLELLDPAVKSSAVPEQVELCADPRLRPDMKRVVIILSKKQSTLEEPTRPGATRPAQLALLRRVVIRHQLTVHVRVGVRVGVERDDDVEHEEPWRFAIAPRRAGVVAEQQGEPKCKEQHILPYEAIALSDTNFKAADTARAWVTETACAWHLQKASPFDEPLQEPPVCIGGHWRRHQQLPCKQDDHEDNGHMAAKHPSKQTVAKHPRNDHNMDGDASAQSKEQPPGTW